MGGIIPHNCLFGVVCKIYNSMICSAKKQQHDVQQNSYPALSPSMSELYKHRLIWYWSPKLKVVNLVTNAFPFVLTFQNELNPCMECDHQAEML